MLGERLMAATLSAAGIPGDRAWALKDETRGGITGAKRFAGLMSMSARLRQEPRPDLPSPEVVIEDAAGPVSSASPDVHARLSAALGSPVSLWPLLPADQREHYLREPLPADVDIAAVLRDLFARTEDEPLPDVSTFPEVLATHATPPGTYFDAFPLLIITRSALRALSAAAAASGVDAAFDLRRFRPNLVLDTDEAGFVENGWAGRTLRLGDAELQVEMACPRCIMTTHGFADLPRDPRIMRSLVRHNAGNLGVYASVRRPGRISVGDIATLV
jgi:uncharacterized protein